MSRGPKFKLDSFWGDLGNALTLTTVYRAPEPVPQPQRELAQAEISQLREDLAEATATIERIRRQLEGAGE